MMKYLKTFERLEIYGSTYKQGDIVRIIRTQKIITNNIAQITYCGIYNEQYIYQLDALEKSPFKFFYNMDITPATKEEIEYFNLRKDANKYNL